MYCSALGCFSNTLRIFISWGLDDSSCLQQMRRMKKQKQTQQSKHRHIGIKESQDKAPERQAVWGQCKKGSKHTQKNYSASCISHQSSSSSTSSSTWTEPPSLSAVRCDPRVSLLVTGVGWDSLPLGSGDLTQRAKRVEAGVREVMRKGGGWEWVGCDVVGMGWG